MEKEQIEYISQDIFNKVKPFIEFERYLYCWDAEDEENEDGLKPLKEIVLAHLISKPALEIFGQFPSLSPKFPGKILKRVLEKFVEYHQSNNYYGEPTQTFIDRITRDLFDDNKKGTLVFPRPL